MARFLRNGRATAVAAVQSPVRCAIYCRKSTTEGLDSAFSSIDNQRLAAENFIASQQHERWSALPEQYSDGGFSGGTTERPALKKLLADVDTGLIDVIVVYRLDRLSRSLADFCRLHEFLEARGVALVSVTESINTKSPHGRMMVNVLLSFAQYERELAGERTAHKLGAARRKGRFTGGFPILGFDLDPKGGRLIVNNDEAQVVREIFQLFLERRSLVQVSSELTRRGITLKRWTTKDGKVFGGGRFDKVNLRRMLTNHTYIGKVAFEGAVYDGEHEAIISAKIFKEVQSVLAENRSTRGAGSRNQHGALLRGVLFCTSCGTAMVHSPTKKNGKLYRYYRCTGGVRNGAASCPTRSIAADKVEAFVVNEIRRIGSDPDLQRETFQQALAQLAAQRRGLRLAEKRLRGDLTKARSHVEQLVGAITRTTGPAADAIQCELARAQGRVSGTEARQREILAEVATIAAQDIDEADVARALEDFDELWGVLLVAERERILKLLIAGIRYDGATGRLDIGWRVAGFGELAKEVADA